MADEFIVAPEAERDIAEAYAWYEGRRTGLGEEFLSCVDACLEGIRRTPEMHAVVHENYRRGLVRRFPYVVFYE
jgi:plasmid stabilization system protein ParE